MAKKVGSEAASVRGRTVTGGRELVGTGGPGRIPSKESRPRLLFDVRWCLHAREVEPGGAMVGSFRCGTKSPRTAALRAAQTCGLPGGRRLRVNSPHHLAGVGRSEWFFRVRVRGAKRRGHWVKVLSVVEVRP
jgi:hypothetical protein